MSNWVFGNFYTFRVLPGQHVIKTLPNEKQTKCVEVLCEVTKGPQAGQQLRYTGFINSKANAARTLAELRVMGFKGRSWGDWTGLGTGKEFEMRVLGDPGRDGKMYARPAFPREKRNIAASDNIATQAEIARLNEGEIGDFDALENEFGGESEPQPHELEGGF